MNELIEQERQRVLGMATATAERARRVPGLTIIEQTLRAYGEDRGSVTAAALAYYALLSIFPFMLFLLALASPFLQSEIAIRLVSGVISGYIPSSTTLLRNTLHEVTQLRGPLTFVAAGGFAWSASGVFNLVQLGMNRAFRVQHARPVWRERMASLVMVAIASLLFGASFLLTTILRFGIHFEHLPRHNVLIDVLSPVGGVIIGVFVFGLIYRYVPYDPTIRWRDVWLGAVLASVFWEVAKLAFAWYLTNYAVLNLVYGSVGTIIAVMLWAYITTVILLFGAEFAAVKSGARQREPTGKEWWALSAGTMPTTNGDGYLNLH